MLLLLFSHSVMANSLWPDGLQHTRLPCPSLSPGVCLNPGPLSRWCHPTISSSVTPSPPALIFLSPRVFSSEMTLCIRWPKYWASASASVLPMCIQSWSPLELTGLTSLLRGLSRVFSSTTTGKHQFFGAQPSLWSKPTAFTSSQHQLVCFHFLAHRNI